MVLRVWGSGQILLGSNPSITYSLGDFGQVASLLFTLDNNFHLLVLL